VLRLLNPLTCDLHNFVKIHFQIKPPSTNHLHFQWSFHPELHFWGNLGVLINRLVNSYVCYTQDTVLFAHKRTHHIYHYLPSHTQCERWGMRHDEDEWGVRGVRWGAIEREAKKSRWQVSLFSTNSYINIFYGAASHIDVIRSSNSSTTWCLRFWGKNQKVNTEHRVPWNLFSRETCYLYFHVKIRDDFEMAKG
jgi:hypothetical protein